MQIDSIQLDILLSLLSLERTEYLKINYNSCLCKNTPFTWHRWTDFYDFQLINVMKTQLKL